MLWSLVRANPLLWKAAGALCVLAFVAGGWGGWWLRASIAKAAETRAETAMRDEVEAIRDTQNEQARDLATKRDAITAWENNGRNALYALVDAGGLGLGCDVGVDGLRWWNEANSGLGFTSPGTTEGVSGGTATGAQLEGARFDGEPSGRGGAVSPVPRAPFGAYFGSHAETTPATLVE